MPDPVFEYTGTSIVVTFKNAPGAVEKGGQKIREKILRFIREHPEITTSELAEKSGVTSKGIEWNISKLKKEGLIKRPVLIKAGIGKCVFNARLAISVISRQNSVLCTFGKGNIACN